MSARSVCLLLALTSAVFGLVNARILGKSKRNSLTINEECGGKLVCGDVYPWMVFIPLKSRVYNPQADIRCVGTLINNRYVVTLKSCLQFVLEEVHLGQYDSSKNVTCQGNPIKKIRVAERVVSDSYDVILLRLDEEVEYSDEINPICLPFESYKKVHDGDKVHASGWGLISHDRNEHVKVMKHIKGTITDSEECKNVYADPNTYDIKTVICVKGNEDSKDNLCNGDEGGPIMHKDNGKWVLDGVLSAMFETPDKPCSINKSARGFRITNDVLEWIVGNIH